MIYIVSRKRPHLLAKSIGPAQAPGLGVTVMVEPGERREYRQVLRDHPDVELITHKRDNIGIERARRNALKRAMKNGHKHIIMCDDDIALSGNEHNLISFMRERKGAAGIAAYLSGYEHFTGIKAWTGVHQHSGSLGKRIWAINAEVATELGCFRLGMPTSEDSEMILRMYRGGYYPWYIHSDVVAKSLANRHAPGGMSSLPGAQQTRELDAYNRLCDEYGEQYFSYTTKGQLRIQWAKFIQQHCH